MKIELYKAEFIEGKYYFTPEIHTGTIPTEFRENNQTFTPNEIRYEDARYFLYCNHDLNEHERHKLVSDWEQSPYSPK